MTRSKVEFANAQGHNLAGLLELPDQGKPRAMALFAHCFTCGKDIAAASRIGRALAGRRFNVKSQMLGDLEQWNTPHHIGNLRKALIIFHSPVDQVVDISEAATIYQAGSIRTFWSRAMAAISEAACRASLTMCLLALSGNSG